MVVKKRTGKGGEAAAGPKNGHAHASSSNKTQKKKKSPEDATEGRYNVGWWGLVGILTIVCSMLHREHLYSLFEGDKHFSHLSNMEREMAFRTEMGLYYSYFKTIVNAETFWDGMHQITQDNVTEYPDTINTLKRFNLYPEVILGAAFRYYINMAETNKWDIKMCYSVNRGEGKSAVPSCEGPGEPTYFYTNIIMELNGMMMGVYFLFGTLVSGSVFGGMITVAGYFFNHGECTRVMWTAPLRESFAFPMLIAQMTYLSYLLKKPHPNWRDSVILALLVVSFMLPWQFAQFALMTQLVAVLGCYVLGYINHKRMTIVTTGHTIGLFVSFVMLFGNEMLLTSFYASCIVAVWGILLLDGMLRKLYYRPIILVVQGIILLTGMVGIKFVVGKLLQVEDDAHIGDILRSKFGDFKSFHTLLYTCAKEFDFLEWDTYVKLTKTGLIPAMLVAVLIFTLTLLRREWNNFMSSESTGVITHDDEDMEDEKEYSEILYNVLQMCAFILMAVIIMRLKLFATPQLCLVASVLASRKLLGSLIPDANFHRALVVLLIVSMGYTGYANLNQQWSIKGEYQNYPQEDLLDWINDNTPKDAVFGGAMPTMANIKLSTLRPIINHPHYEDAGIRERTKKIYYMTSRKTKKELYDICKELKVQYIVYEGGWCVRSNAGDGCTMPEIWDVEDPANRGKEPLCLVMVRDSTPYFKQVYKNVKFDVFKVLDNVVE